jgi:hypothetical protein
MDMLDQLVIKAFFLSLPKSKPTTACGVLGYAN